MDEAERLQLFIDHLFMKVPEFARSINVSQDILYKILRHETKLTTFVKGNLFRSYPNLNRVWFETGQGEMLLKSEKQNPEIVQDEQSEYMNQYRQALAEKDLIIETYEKIIRQQRETIIMLSELKNVKNPLDDKKESGE